MSASSRRICICGSHILCRQKLRPVATSRQEVRLAPDESPAQRYSAAIDVLEKTPPLVGGGASSTYWQVPPTGRTDVTCIRDIAVPERSLAAPGAAELEPLLRELSPAVVLALVPAALVMTRPRTSTLCPT
jgi:hypothetical protein